MKPKIIFFGNGPLADAAKAVLANSCEIIFHARTKSDLETVAQLKSENPDAYGILASFGVIIKPELLKLFAPTGIINIHPSLLPEYRGPSPIEASILDGANDFSYSIMQLAPAMDAGPIFHQATLENLPLNKAEIYHALATAGATWIVEHLTDLPEPVPQDSTHATYTKKLSKSQSFLEPEKYPAETIFRQIIAFQNFPKPKYEFFGKTCIILAAHTLRITDILCEAAGLDGAPDNSPLMLKCADRNFVVIDRLQPEGKKPMDATSFINGYGTKQPEPPTIPHPF